MLILVPISLAKSQSFDKVQMRWLTGGKGPRLAGLSSLDMNHFLGPLKLFLSEGLVGDFSTGAGLDPRIDDALNSFLPLSRILSDPTLKTKNDRDIFLSQDSPHRDVTVDLDDESGSLKNHPKRILVMGGLHGNEPGGSEFIFWLLSRYKAKEGALWTLRHWLEENQTTQLTFDFLPIANPDGRALNSRYNAAGIDLNRNFPILYDHSGPRGHTEMRQGSSPLSEPETKAIAKLFSQRRYSMAFDVHGYINWIVGPTDTKNMMAWQKEAGLSWSYNKERISANTSWLKTLKALMPSLGPRYMLKDSYHLGQGGAFEDFAFWRHGAKSVCIEIDTEDKVIKEDQSDFIWSKYEKFLALTILKEYHQSSSTSH